MTKFSNLHYLLPALFCTTAVVATPALAQDAPPEDQSTQQPDVEEAGEEIVVSGIRGSLQRSINVKREAPSVVDAISSEDVGKFPDINVAESVQRISGVQINRNRGEGQTVNIRGLPSTFTLATLNGRSIPNALSNGDQIATRSFDFQILPPEFIRTLEVYKAPTADLEEGGLSGLVNVKTPHAFDIGKRVLRGSVQGEFDDNSGKISPRLSAFFSDTFLDQRLGITLGGSYLKRDYETHANQINYVSATEQQGIGGGPDDLNGNGVIDPALRVRIPGTNFYNIFRNKSERISALGSIEFQATDGLRLYADGFYSKLKFKSPRFEFLPFFSNSPTVISSQVQVLEGLPTATSFRVANLDLRQGGRVEERTGDLWTAVGGANYEADRFKLNFEVARSKSSQTRDNLNIANSSVGGIEAQYDATTIDGVGGIRFFGTGDQLRLDPNSFRILSLNGEFNRQSRDVITDVKLDGQYELGDSGLTQILVGGKFADRKQYQDNGRLVISAAQMSTMWQQATGSPLAAVPGRAGTVSAAPFLVPIQPGRGSFLGSYNGSAAFPANWLGTDLYAFTDRFSREQLRAGGTFTNDATGIIDVSERTWAFYVRADYKFGKVDGNIGARWVNTRQLSVGVSPDLRGITVEPQAGNITRVPAASPVSVTRSYSMLLPSFNLRFRPNDDLVIRAAASRTLARPDLSQISPTISVNGVALVITQQNPQLDPFVSDNIDLTAEWYFNRSSLAGISLFHKNLKSLVRNVSVVQTLPITIINADGSRTPSNSDFTVNTLENGAGVKLKGMELYLQTNLDFLPSPLDGLGAQLNYTYIDNSDPSLLTAASKHNYNISLFYEKGPIGARFTYSWRDKFLSVPSQSFNMGTVVKPYGTLDGSLTFQINDAIGLVVEAVNILDADETTSFTTGLPREYTDAGRRVQFGVRASF